MPRRTIASLSAAALTAAALATIAAGQNTNTATAAAADQTLTAPNPQSHYVASKPNGPSTGDIFLDAGRLMDAHGRNAGVLIQSCEAYFLGKAQLSSCTGAISLAGGQITFAEGGPESNSTTSAYAVTGGTGTYQTARGTITTVFQKSGKLTVRIALR